MKLVNEKLSVNSALEHELLITVWMEIDQAIAALSTLETIYHYRNVLQNNSALSLYNCSRKCLKELQDTRELSHTMALMQGNPYPDDRQR